MTNQDNRKTAALLVCDASYLPFALHLVNQILHFCPDRTFDLVIASEQALELPLWAVEAGVHFHRMSSADLPHDLPKTDFPRATYFRIMAPDQLVGRYRRILYLDCDMVMDGGDLDRLLNIDLGGHVIAAVRDAMMFTTARHHPPEFRMTGLPALPYFNTGLILVDTDAYVREEIAAKTIRVIETRRQAILYADQSALNLVFQGRFAQLSPVWNWMSNGKFPFVSRSVPVRIHHFIDKTKPWNDPGGKLDARFRESYAHFFATRLPEAMPKLLTPPGPRILPFDRLFTDLLVHALNRATNLGRFGEFRDEWEVKT